MLLVKVTSCPPGYWEYKIQKALAQLCVGNVVRRNLVEGDM